MGNLKAKITETLGRWTNDRKTEARGRAEHKDPDPEAPLPDPDDPSVKQEEDHVRHEHGDMNG